MGTQPVDVGYLTYLRNEMLAGSPLLSAIPGLLAFPCPVTEGPDLVVHAKGPGLGAVAGLVRVRSMGSQGPGLTLQVFCPLGSCLPRDTEHQNPRV